MVNKMNQQETLSRIFFEHDPLGLSCKTHDLYDEYDKEAEYFLQLTEGTVEERLIQTFDKFFAPLKIKLLDDDLVDDIKKSLYS